MLRLGLRCSLYLLAALSPDLAGGSAGGGSGHVSAAGTNVVNETGVRAGNGLVVISYARTPPSTAACKNGGRRNFVDDRGQPFPNQGQCVSWVLHHT